MGAIVWSLENFLNTMLDVVIIKTGLVISEDFLVEILREEFPDERIFINASKRRNYPVRIRSEEFDFYCWHVRKRLGELEKVQPSIITYAHRMMEWDEKGFDPIKVTRRILDIMTEIHDEADPKLIDPTIVIEKAIKENLAPVALIFDVIDSLVDNQKMSNTIFPVDELMWDGGTNLNELFDKESLPKKNGDFIEQKFINFLQANPEKLEFMHWRNFERLTAEFFKREKYEVVLGPGTNDGGIDLRVYDKNDISKPYIIVQCKRHKKSNQVKIETVKSFYTDVEFEGAKKGLIATTSKVAIGGKKVSSIRKYPLHFAENEEIKNWVNKMKKR